MMAASQHAFLQWEIIIAIVDEKCAAAPPCHDEK
jgi:hypothetical protein